MRGTGRIQQCSICCNIWGPTSLCFIVTPYLTKLAEPHNATDLELVAAVCAGDRVVFEKLVQQHNQRLYRVVRAVLRSDNDAEDALQQTWLVIYRNLASFRGEAAFSTWATRIAARTAIALAHKIPAIAEVEDMVDARETPEAMTARYQLGSLFEKLLAQLPQGHREVLVLRDVMEMDTAETAICLQISEAAVRVRLHRARADIAALLTTSLAHDAQAVYAFDGARCARITAFVMHAVESL